MLVQFDHRLRMRDLYFPRVGQVNHIQSAHNQIGVWVEGRFSWVYQDDWEHRPGYRQGTLVTESSAVNLKLGIAIRFSDGVHPWENILVRQIRIQNLADRPRPVLLFATHDFDLEETDVGDTALWSPTLGAMIHYHRNRWFLIGGMGPKGGIHQYTVGRKRYQAEGTWRDAEDGHLEGHTISQGAVDSTVSLKAELDAGGSADLYLWIVCASDHDSAAAGHQLVGAAGPEQLIDRITRYWYGWVASGNPVWRNLPEDLQSAYQRSLMVIRTQVDNGGAIVAANDSDILQCARDHYSYMWPRDGAFVAAALDRAGFGSVTRRFYRFCEATLDSAGHFWHKYNPDGTLGSSWHPLLSNTGEQLPIQEDETALVLWGLGMHREDQEFIAALYDPLIKPAADFLVSYRDGETKLPKESYDLWEERRGVFTFTTAAVVAGLQAAADMASSVGDASAAKRYQDTAQETRDAMLKYLWSEEEQCFARGFYARRIGGRVLDTTPDISIIGLFLLGILSPTDPKMEATVDRLERELQIRTAVGGIARYYDDYYFRVTDDLSLAPGNPWVLATLWVARWYIARAHSAEELEPAMEYIRLALSFALPTGILPEQVNPLNGKPLSVAPLTWSHATLVDTLLDLAEKLSVF